MRYYFLLLLPLLLCTCDRAQETGKQETTDTPPPIHRLSGEAMGSYYRVTYVGDSLPNLQTSIDSLLDAYNLELSAWVPASRLNAFNQSETGIDLSGTQHFLPNLNLATRISTATNGAYDPTIAPLSKFWGFNTGTPRTSANVDATEVANLLTLVGMANVKVVNSQLTKSKPGVQLDLNASAKGYGVDLLSAMLTDRNRPNHLIDIGGEMRGGGNKYGRAWNVAIRLPDEDKSKIARAGTLPLRDGRAIATSGNYESYYKVDGETFSHTINPKTGYPERNRLLSASVLAPNCAIADAYATACMVLGPEGALALVEADSTLEGYFLIRADDGGLEIVKSSGL